jgi:hypothetical protein
MHKVIYYNPNLSHQVAHAKAFEACGFTSSIGVIKPAPEVCVVSGPHYARDACSDHTRVLMIDRAWWGDGDDDPKVSIGWLQADGTRKFATGDAERPKPELEPWKTREQSCLVLADYSENVLDAQIKAAERFGRAFIRLHPANDTSRRVELEDAVRLRDVVVGGKGTAVFEAIIQGVPVICHPDNACAEVCATDMDAPLFRGDRTKWLHDMSYKQFSLSEIADGTAWNLLKDVQ